MIKLQDYEEFQEFTTLKETSKNDADKKDVLYMVDSEFPVIDFDKVKERYISNLSLMDTPKSNDALLQLDGKLYFIEFKDGNIKSEIYGIRRKIYESLLIFCDIVGKNISFTRENMNYILVYNKENSKKYIQEMIDKRKKESSTLSKKEMNESLAFEQFRDIMGDLSKKKIDIFGLEKQFKNMYFHEVYTYDKREFIEEFVSKLTE